MTSPRTSLDLNFDFQKASVANSQAALNYIQLIPIRQPLHTLYFDESPPLLTRGFSRQIQAGKAFYPYASLTSTPQSSRFFEREKQPKPKRLFDTETTETAETAETAEQSVVLL